jgi:hypothetical protein
MENGLCQDAIGPNGKSDFNSYADALWWGVVSTSAGWGGGAYTGGKYHWLGSVEFLLGGVSLLVEAVKNSGEE